MVSVRQEGMSDFLTCLFYDGNCIRVENSCLRVLRGKDKMKRYG